MGVGEGAIRDLNEPLTAGHLDEVGVSGGGAARGGVGLKVHVVEGHVFRELTHHAEAVEEAHIQMVEGHVLALPEEGPGVVPDGGAHW